MKLYSNDYSRGRLDIKRQGGQVRSHVTPGLQSLELAPSMEALLYVPPLYSHDQAAPLALMLHGAGEKAEQAIGLLREYADKNNMLIVAPSSHGYTWDLVATERFGEDVAAIDRVLAEVIERFTVDPERIAIGGFADGASYALSLGLTNGDLFTHILAFSPGFAFTSARFGMPDVFVAHGKHDTIRPIEECSSRIVQKLQQEGLTVEYDEFDGEHTIPENVSRKAVEWFVQHK